jgi:hypothetical protein
LESALAALGVVIRFIFFTTPSLFLELIGALRKLFTKTDAKEKREKKIEV